MTRTELLILKNQIAIMKALARIMPSTSISHIGPEQAELLAQIQKSQDKIQYWGDNQ